MLFGLAALFWPGVTLFVLLVCFGVYVLVDGLLAIVAAIRASGGRRWLLLAEGALGFLAGLVVLFWPGTTALVLELRYSLTEFGAASARVAEMVNTPSVSYFTRRGGLIELAISFALRGERTRAANALDAARRIALAGADTRGTARWLVCHALCTALTDGPERARPSLEEARGQAADRTVVVDPNLAATEAFVAGRSADVGLGRS